MDSFRQHQILLACVESVRRYELPVPETFAIDRAGLVRAAFADTDSRKRMEPSAIIQALRSIDPS